MKRLINRNNKLLTYRFTDPDTGYQYSAKYIDFNALIRHVVAYRRINNLPQIVGLEELVEFYLAEIPENLSYTEDRADTVPMELRHYISGGKAFLETAKRAWQDKRYAWVDQKEAEERAAVCIRCKYNAGGIKDHNVFEKAVRFLQNIQVGDKSTRYDNQLGQCTMCLCDIRKKIWYPQDVVDASLDKDTKLRLPADNMRGIDGQLIYCWQLGKKK